MLTQDFYKTYLNVRHQFIVFDVNGVIKESDDTLIALTKQKEKMPFFDIFPFFECVRYELETQSIGDKLAYDCIGLKLNENQENFDINIEKINDSDFLCILELRTEKNKYWLDIQQERNESIINKELIEKQSRIIDEKNRNITASILYAKNIQKAMLPDEELIKSLFPNSFVLFKPKDIVSGDFYWIGEKDGKIIFTVSDCTGHGVPGSLMSMISISLLKESVYRKNILQPSEILGNIRTELIKSLNHKNESEGPKDGMDSALCVITAESNMEYAGAYNNLILIRQKDDTPIKSYNNLTDSFNLHHPEITDENKSLFIIDSDRQPVGQYFNQKPFTNHQIKLKQGDVIYLFTDGYHDQFDKKNKKKFYRKNFYKTLFDIQNRNIAEHGNILSKIHHEWRGDIEQLDDICIMGIQF